MKKAIVGSSMHLIEDIFPEYEQEQLEVVQYGLEGIYMLITKLVVIFFVAYLLGIFQEAVVLLLLFNVLRTTAFGLHAAKSWMCWVSSTIVFIGCPLLCLTLRLPVWVLFIIGCICLINFFLYAPSDTEKRPLVNKKKRIIYKIITLISGIIYLILLFIIKDAFLKNALVCAMVIQSVLIHPMVYKVFKLPYANYKSYVFSK